MDLKIEFLILTMACSESMIINYNYYDKYKGKLLERNTTIGLFQSHLSQNEETKLKKCFIFYN